MSVTTAADKLREMTKKFKIATPSPVVKKVDAPTAVERPQQKGQYVVDLKARVEVDRLTGEVFDIMDEHQKQVDRLSRVQNPSDSELGEIAERKQTLADMKAAFMVDDRLYQKWIAGPLLAPDELMIMNDFVGRGFLVVISQAAYDEYGKRWKEYNETRRAAKEGEMPAFPEGLVPTYKTTVPVHISPTQTVPQHHYFAQPVFNAGEQRPKGIKFFYDALKVHFKDKREHNRKRFENEKRASEAAEKMVADYPRLTQEMLDTLKPDQGKTLADVERAVRANTVAFEVTAEREWQHFNQTVTGTVVVRNEKAEDGIAKLTVLGATGTISPSLVKYTASADGKKPAVVFQYLAGKRFEGMSFEADGIAQTWLRILLSKVAGFYTGVRRQQGGQQYDPKYTPQTPRGHRSDEDSGPRKGKGRRGRKERGGGHTRRHEKADDE